MPIIGEIRHKPVIEPTPIDPNQLPVLLMIRGPKDAVAYKICNYVEDLPKDDLFVILMTNVKCDFVGTSLIMSKGLSV